MKRTTIFLDDDLELRLNEAAARTGRAKADIVRAALDEYLHRQGRPWPSSVGMGQSSDSDVTSANVKEWIHREWDKSALSFNR